MGQKTEYPQDIEVISVTIAESAQLSGAANGEAFRVVGIWLPAALTGTALTFEVSQDGSTYQELYYDGAAYSETVAAAKMVSVNPIVFFPWQYVKVKSGSAEAAARTVKLITRRV